VKEVDILSVALLPAADVSDHVVRHHGIALQQINYEFRNCLGMKLDLFAN
jgi:hypothetical protein